MGGGSQDWRLLASFSIFAVSFRLKDEGNRNLLKKGMWFCCLLGFLSKKMIEKLAHKVSD